MGTLAPSLAFLSLATITWGSVLPRPKFSKLSLTKAETNTEAAIIEFILFNTAETNLKLCTQKGDQAPVCVSVFSERVYRGNWWHPMNFSIDPRQITSTLSVTVN